SGTKVPLTGSSNPAEPPAPPHEEGIPDSRCGLSNTNSACSPKRESKFQVLEVAARLERGRVFFSGRRRLAAGPLAWRLLVGCRGGGRGRCPTRRSSSAEPRPTRSKTRREIGTVKLTLFGFLLALASCISPARADDPLVVDPWPCRPQGEIGKVGEEK